MLNRVLIVLISLIIQSCYWQADYGLINNWKSYPVPANADTLRKYNNSLNEWCVSIGNNIVQVNKYKPSYQSIVPFKINPNPADKSKMIGVVSFVKVADGYLIGFNGGEWRGHLYWFANDGKNYYEISDDQIVQFIKRNGQIYAIQGLAHLGISEGSIIKIEKKDGKWAAKEYLKLPKAPYCFSVDSEKDFIVLTSNNLLKVDSSKSIKTIVNAGVWSNGLYPNSLVIKDDIVYAGMRAGVYKYNLSNGKQEWLLPY
jgi:hypothetical protein